jgi:hypothetical protein
MDDAGRIVERGQSICRGDLYDFAFVVMRTLRLTSGLVGTVQFHQGMLSNLHSPWPIDTGKCRSTFIP